MNTKPVNRITLLNMTIFVEALLLLVATGWSQYAGISLLKTFHFNFKILVMGIGTGLAMGLLGFVCYYFSRRFSAFGQLRDLVENFLTPMVADLKLIDLLIVAAISGFCEEVFFRGVAQQQFGLIITSVAFGLFHDPSFRYVAYSFFAFIYGLILGVLFIYTGSLWAPIIAHVIHNLISLYILRYHIKPPEAPA